MWWWWWWCDLYARNKVKYILNTAHLKLLYHSLIEPYLNYCCIIWANPQKNGSLESIFKLQKRAIRIITYSAFYAHTRSLFHKLSILNIYNLCLNQILIFVYKSLNNLIPSHCNHYFTKTKDMHSYNTRGHKHRLYIVSAKKSCRNTSFLSTGPKHWNKLPTSLQSAFSIFIFKKLLKQHIISLQSLS